MEGCGGEVLEGLGMPEGVAALNLGLEEGEFVGNLAGGDVDGGEVWGGGEGLCGCG